MHKITLLVLFLITAITVNAQRKSDLLAEIDDLKSELQAVQQQLAEANRQISSSEARAESLANENVGLRDANATLLKNLSSFSELSRKNTENVNSALASLERKEQQLSLVTETMAKNDSTAIVLLSRTKQRLGSDARVSTANGDVIISNSLDVLFGGDASTTLTPEANTWLASIAEIIRSNPSRAVVVEGLNITGEFDVTLKQATAITTALLVTHGITPDKVNTTVRDGNFKEGIAIRLQPDYKQFYSTAKETMRNQ